MTNQAIQNDKRVTKVVTDLNALMTELKFLFPERSLIISQLIYALLVKEHALITGIYGTGKSSLGNAIFSAFEGATIYKQSFNKFLDDQAVFGAINIERLRAESVQTHNPAGSLLEADFAVLDEFLDANTSLLRALHTILNERRFVNGGNQQMELPLHTAFAATNVDLAKTVKDNPEHAPIIDRFMFKSPAEWLELPASRVALYKNDAAVLLPKTKIKLEDLQYLSNIVIDQNQYAGLPDDIFILYDKIMSEFRASIARDAKTLPSDRFFKNLLKVPEASALLHGRFHVIPDDFLACAIALCVDGNPEFKDRFLDIAKPHVEKAMEAEQHIEEDRATYDIIERYRAEVNVDSDKIGSMDNPNDVRNVILNLRDLHNKALSITPSTVSGEEAKDQLIADVLSAINQGEVRYESFVRNP